MEITDWVLIMGTWLWTVIVLGYHITKLEKKIEQLEKD